MKRPMTDLSDVDNVYVTPANQSAPDQRQSKRKSKRKSRSQQSRHTRTLGKSESWSEARRREVELVRRLGCCCYCFVLGENGKRKTLP